MSSRPTLLMIGQLFLALVFLCAPVADHLHVIKMLQGQATQHEVEMAAAEPAPCHEQVMIPADVAESDSADDKLPCCPYEQCSPNNCLVHFSVVAFSALAISPHSPIDSRTFTDAELLMISVPFTERLRPPIA